MMPRGVTMRGRVVRWYHVSECVRRSGPDGRPEKQAGTPEPAGALVLAGRPVQKSVHRIPKTEFQAQSAAPDPLHLPCLHGSP